MIYFPSAKINLGLHITEKRQDGYHNIETVFYPVSLSDILEVICLSDDSSNQNIFINTGNLVDGNSSENLCLMAWKELNKKHPLPYVNIHLHKMIPFGAGLGGGSSNAAFVLKALNEIFKLNLQTVELESIAASIGSDCPFFINNKPRYAMGKGDVFENFEIDLSGTHIVIIHPPDIHVSTRWAYSKVEIREYNRSVKDIIITDPGEWQGRLVNDFEKEVFKVYPIIRNIKERLLESGAFYASMTGSGSAVYGLYDQKIDATKIKQKFPGMFLWEGVL